MELISVAPFGTTADNHTVVHSCSVVGLTASWRWRLPLVRRSLPPLPLLTTGGNSGKDYFYLQVVACPSARDPQSPWLSLERQGIEKDQGMQDVAHLSLEPDIAQNT